MLYNNISLIEDINTCWICLEKCNTSKKICNCNNFISYIHTDCYLNWQISIKSNKCSFCKNKYIFDKSDFLMYYIYLFIKTINYKNILTSINNSIVELIRIFNEFSDYNLENRLLG